MDLLPAGVGYGPRRLLGLEQSAKPTLCLELPGVTWPIELIFRAKRSHVGPLLVLPHGGSANSFEVEQRKALIDDLAVTHRPSCLHTLLDFVLNAIAENGFTKRLTRICKLVGKFTHLTSKRCLLSCNLHGRPAYAPP